MGTDKFTHISAWDPERKKKENDDRRRRLTHRQVLLASMLIASRGGGTPWEGGSGVGGASVPVLTWTSGTTEYANPTFTATNIAETDVVDIQIDDDIAFGSLFDSESNPIDAVEASDGLLLFPGISTLGFATTYYARIRKNGGVWSNVVSKAMAAAPSDPTVWNSAAKSSFIALSGANLIATGSSGVGAAQPVLATNSKTTGKRYAEVQINPVVAFDGFGIGLVNTLPANYVNPGADANGIFYASGGEVKHNNVALATQAAATADILYVMGVALDADADKCWFSLDGVFVGDPAAGTGGYSISSIATYFLIFAPSNAATGTLRRTASEFTGVVPTGFTGWDD